MQSIDDSLKRLGTDFIDLYQIHRWDDETPIEETMEALHDLVRAGKVHYIGGSSMAAWQFSKAQHFAERRGMTPFISMQNHYNLIYREEEREMLPLCQDQGVGIITWSPLARGILSGTRTKEQITQGDTARSKTDPMIANMYGSPDTIDNDFQIVERVVELAKKKGVTPSQISLAWLLHQPQVVAPIVGATKMKHLIEAVDSLKVKLSPEEMKRLEEVYKPHHIAPKSSHQHL